MDNENTYDGSEPLENAGHERFCQEYLLDLCGGRAWERAGYNTTGRSADANACRALTDANLQKRIAFLKEERKKRLGIDADRVLEELALIAYGDLNHYQVDEDGNVQIADGAPAGASRVLSAVKRKIRVYRRGDTDVKEVDVEIKTWNKNAALRDLGQHLGLFGAKGTEEDPGVVKIIMERVTKDD